jgi:hypothetical protein
MIFRVQAIILVAQRLLLTMPTSAEGYDHVFHEQEAFPAPPSDQTRVYMADDKGAIAPLPLEEATTQLNMDSIARSDKVSYVELKGEHAAAMAPGEIPRFFLFVEDKLGIHAPFLVRLTPHGKARRFGAAAQRGMRGFAVMSEDIVKPNYRVLSHIGGMIFMEVRAREPLAPGEYAFVGLDLRRVATFRVATT